MDEKETERRVHLAEKMTKIEGCLEQNSKLTAEMHSAIMGNGGPGILTRLALHGKAIKIQWWFIAAIFLSVMASAAYVVKAGILK